MKTRVYATPAVKGLSQWCFNANIKMCPYISTLEALSYMNGIMHNLSNPFFGVLSNQVLTVLTFLLNQAAEIKPVKA